jgi:hypothetical protein
VENGIQVEKAGNYFVGSQEIEPGNGWPYNRILAALTAKPTMDGQQLAQVIVKEYAGSYGDDEAVTQSAFDLAALSAVGKAADALGDLLAAGLGDPNDLSVEGAVSRARRQAQKYDHPDYVDLWDFGAKLAALLPSSGKAVSAVQQAIGKCVFANAARHPNISQSHGLSIYLPKDELNPLYAKLDFARGGWAKFVEVFTKL